MDLEILSLTMDICFVPSLENLAGAKIVTVLLSGLDVNLFLGYVGEEEILQMNKLKKNLSKLLPFNRLREKLEHFMPPIVNEIEKWADLFIEEEEELPKICSSQLCWLSNGCIDREKSADILVKSSDINPLSKFVIACIFCRFQDILDLWNGLYKKEKACLRERYFVLNHYSFPIVRRWIEWLDNSDVNKDWESFTAWVFKTGLYKNNLYMMKHVLESSSPEVKSHYALQAFHEKGISIEIKRFCLMMMSTGERSVIFREYPVDVCKCFLSWPLRCNFMDLMDNLWPYVTTGTFCNILSVILNMIRNEEKDYVDLLVILKTLWKQSPGQYKKAAKNDCDINVPLNFVLNYDFKQDFSMWSFEDCFDLDSNCSEDEQSQVNSFWNILNGTNNL